MTILFRLPILLLLLSLHACGPKPQHALDLSDWSLQYWLGQQMEKPDATVTAHFTVDRVTGDVGPNEYNSGFRLHGETGITFRHQQIAENTDAMTDRERNGRFLKLLQTAAFYARKESELIFYDEYGQELLVFQALSHD